MDKTELIKTLKTLVDESQVITDEQAILNASKDYIGFRRYQRTAGKFWVPRAACVVNVYNTEEVSKVLKFLNDNNVDIVPRTGGSCATKGLEPQEGGVIIDASGMNEIVGISEEDMLITVKCGTPMQYIEDALNKRGYTSGHFPQSLPMASIGGLVATKSIGQFSTLYGGIENLVVGLEAVLADGSVIRIKNVPRRSAGPDLRHLFIGSEGAFAFITEVTLKIFKYRPENRWMKAYAVKDMRCGLAFIRDFMTDGYLPAVVRLHDYTEVSKIFKFDVPEGYCMLLLIAEGPANIAKATGEGIAETAKKYEAVDLGSRPVEIWLKTRNDICDHMDDSFLYDFLHDSGVVADTCEISATWSEIGNIYEAVLDRVKKEVPELVMISGHSSHSYLIGTNIYFQFGIMVNDVNNVEAQYMQLVSIIMQETLKRGGSIAHHHGSGKYRTQWMDQEHGSSYQLMYRLKKALDEKGIFNKGVILK